MADILSELRAPLVMSMFVSRRALYQEGERQRAAAADEIEKLRTALTTMASRYELYCGGADLPHAGDTDRAIVEMARGVLADNEREASDNG